MVGRFTEDSLDDISWIVGINLWGVVHGCHHFLPMLLEADEAHVVNVSSMAGLLGIPQNLGTHSRRVPCIFLGGSALELVGTNVGVSTLFPGAVYTNIMKGARGGQAPQLAKFGEAWFARYVSRSPEAAARQIVRAIKYNHARVLLGPECRMVDLAARIIPGRSPGPVGRALDPSSPKTSVGTQPSSLFRRRLTLFREDCPHAPVTWDGYRTSWSNVPSCLSPHARTLEGPGPGRL